MTFPLLALNPAGPLPDGVTPLRLGAAAALRGLSTPTLGAGRPAGPRDLDDPLGFPGAPLTR